MKILTGLCFIQLCFFSSCHKQEKPDGTSSFSWLFEGSTSIKTKWGVTFGGSLSDETMNNKTVIRLPSGSYVIVGSTASNNGSFTGVHGGKDIFVMKLDASGTKIWSRVYGGSGEDIPTSVMYTDDYSLIVTGSTTSNDGDITFNHGKKDAWVLKLDHFDGNLIWQNTFGGPENDQVADVAVSQLFSLYVVGTTEGNFFSVNDHHGLEDVWVINISAISGHLLWHKFFGGTGSDVCIGLTNNSLGYVLTGYTNSNDGDVPKNRGNKDVWILIFDSMGKIISSQTFGGAMDDLPHSITSFRDGTVLITGKTFSNDGDMIGNHGKSDVFVAKFGPNTRKEWIKTFGGSENDEGNSITITSDDGMLIGGKTESHDGDVNYNRGNGDGWVFKLGNVGMRYWQRTVGGAKTDHLHSVYASDKDDLILVGTSNSVDGDISNNRGDNDIFVLNLK